MTMDISFNQLINWRTMLQMVLISIKIAYVKSHYRKVAGKSFKLEKAAPHAGHKAKLAHKNNTF